MTAEDPCVRRLFERQTLLESDWYRRRLRAKQTRDVALWSRHVAALEAVPALKGRLEEARRQLARAGSPEYLAELEGTIGADPSLGNPWLSVPLRDYEDHMNSEPVGQLSALAELFGEALRSCRPESVAILGVAGGNGLEHIDPAVTRRVCGIDVNPEYLEAVRQRFAAAPGLELHCLDLAESHAQLAPARLVHAALIFEHAGLGRCLENALNLVAPGAALSVVLQLPSAAAEPVNGAAHPSIQALRHGFQLIDPGHLSREVEGRGFRFVRSMRHPLPSGKAFWLGLFERPAPA